MSIVISLEKSSVLFWFSVCSFRSSDLNCNNYSHMRKCSNSSASFYLVSQPRSRTSHSHPHTSHLFLSSVIDFHLERRIHTDTTLATLRSIVRPPPSSWWSRQQMTMTKQTLQVHMRSSLCDVPVLTDFETSVDNFLTISSCTSEEKPLLHSFLRYLITECRNEKRSGRLSHVRGIVCFGVNWTAETIVTARAYGKYLFVRLVLIAKWWWILRKDVCSLLIG